MNKQKNESRKSMFVNILVSFASFLSVILFLEFIVFRFFFIPSEIPIKGMKEGVIKLKPHQKGVFRIKDESKSAFNINANGWNSKYDFYSLSKKGRRIAVIGDSYVEAIQVNFNDSFAEQLEYLLKTQNKEREGVEVYRFGVSGAPLSQYYFALKKEVIKYSPDLVIILLIHNDFNESYEYPPGRDRTNKQSYFLKFKIENGGVIEEIEPRLKNDPYEIIKKSSILRYFYYRQKISLRNIFFLKNKLMGEKREFQANIDVTNLEEKMPKNRIVTDYVFNKLSQLSQKYGFEILIVMDGNRDLIYSGKNSEVNYKEGALRLNSMAKNVAQKYNIPFIDMHPVFEKDFLLHRKKFNYIHDNHWNSYGHNIVAKTIYLKVDSFRHARGGSFLKTEEYLTTPMVSP